MRSRCADLPVTRARRPNRGARGAASLGCPYLFDWPEGAGLDRPSFRPRVSPRLAPDAPGAVVDVVALAERGRGVVVVLGDVDFGRVVVVVEDLVVEPLAVVVVVDDLVVDPLAVVVVVDGLRVELLVVVVVDDLVVGGLVVVVVEAFGTFGSSLAGVSSRAWAGAPAAT